MCIEKKKNKLTTQSVQYMWKIGCFSKLSSDCNFSLLNLVNSASKYTNLVVRPYDLLHSHESWGKAAAKGASKVQNKFQSPAPTNKITYSIMVYFLFLNKKSVKLTGHNRFVCHPLMITWWVIDPLHFSSSTYINFVCITRKLLPSNQMIDTHFLHTYGHICFISYEKFVHTLFI